MDKEKIAAFDIGILNRMDATEIAARIKKGDFSAQEAMDCVQERTEAVNPLINAIVHSDFEVNKPKAAQPGDAVFAGVPTFIKDLLNVKGFPTSQGSKALSKTIRKKGDKVIKQIESTGCIIVGKTTTSEFGLLPATETYVTGDTCNPHHLGYSTGGSSGGAGALVAAGVVPFAHAADGGGSIRIPASCCGLVGLKPSRGRHNESPTKKMPIDIVTQGIVSRSVRDTANYYHAIDQYQRNNKLAPIDKIIGPSKKRLKIAFYTDSLASIDSHPDVETALFRTKKICEDLGHEIIPIKNPFGPDVLFDFLIYYSFLAKMASEFGKLTYDKKFNGKLLEPFTKELGGYFSKLMILFPASIKRLKKDLVENYNNQFKDYDVLLSPVLSAPVPPIGHFGTEVPFLSHIMKLNTYLNSTIVQNATGTPAISLPMGKCSNGLPIGSMFAANIGEENKLLELAFELEEAEAFMPFLG